MSSQQIVDYIANQIKKGHNEKNLRKHLRVHGWSASAIDDAFKRYHGTVKRSRPIRRKLNSRQRLKEALKVTVVLAVLTAVVGLVVHFSQQSPSLPTAAKQAAPSFSQQQALDIVTIGGAIGQFTAQSNGVLPTRLAVGTSNSLVMCDTVCNPTTSQTSSLLAYQASNVHMKPYGADLAVPNVQTVYLVPGATCSSKKLGPASALPRAMVLLYATTAGKTFSQRCAQL